MELFERFCPLVSVFRIYFLGKSSVRTGLGPEVALLFLKNRPLNTFHQMRTLYRARYGFGANKIPRDHGASHLYGARQLPRDH